jgi:hypothetical protein
LSSSFAPVFVKFSLPLNVGLTAVCFYESSFCKWKDDFSSSLFIVPATRALEPK